MKILC